MKREIKFRAKRTGDGVWVYGDLTHTSKICNEEEKKSTGKASMPCIRISNYDVDEETICQMLQYRDKNGTQIYEGDIVHVITKSDCFNSTREYNTQADYEGVFKHIAYNVWGDSPVMEVIGNIYDNPELKSSSINPLIGTNFI